MLEARTVKSVCWENENFMVKEGGLLIVRIEFIFALVMDELKKKKKMLLFKAF